VIVLLIFIGGCSMASDISKNLTDAVFSRPQQVKKKIHNPIKDNVRFSVLWIGHASTLIQIEDKVILLDPVFEDVIASLMLRKVEAGLDIKDLPRLDLVLISHAHMDHLSLPTLKDLDRKFPKATVVFPAGTEQYMPSLKMNMIRMKTGNSAKSHYIGESKIIDGVKITTVYANHPGGRYVIDSYVWFEPGATGYIIEYKGITVFFAGDTVYDKKAYKELGKEYDIDLAILPIGPCIDCEAMDFGFHMGSFGAMNLLDDINARYMLPIHYGSSTYGSDPDLPVKTLTYLINKYYKETVTGIMWTQSYKQKILILDEGEQFIFDNEKFIQVESTVNNDNTDTLIKPVESDTLQKILNEEEKVIDEKRELEKNK
jgi:L-ascorbate metabolism protein UlaG (beta-lactamase superfamily)